MTIREKHNREELSKAFADAREHPGYYGKASLLTSTGEHFRLDIAADESFSSRSDVVSVKNLDGVDLPKFEYMISSPDMFSYDTQLGDRSRRRFNAGNKYAASGDIVRHEITLFNSTFVHSSTTEEGYTNMILHDMDNFQFVKNEDLRMKRYIVDEMLSGHGSVIEKDVRGNERVYLDETLADMHRDVYGNKPTTDTTDKSMMIVSCMKDGKDASYAFGPKVNIVGGNGVNTAFFYPGYNQGETPTIQAMNYCQLNNMHMLYGTEFDGGTNGDTLVCFTEPDALIREIDGKQNTFMRDWARLQMAMGKDMMGNTAFIGVPYKDGCEPKHPEDNISTSRKCLMAMVDASRDPGHDVAFDGYVATGKKATFVVNADNTEGMDIKMTAYDGNPVKHRVAITNDMDKQDDILRAFNALTRNSVSMENALKSGYDYSYGKESFSMDISQQSQSEDKKDVSYKLGKDSHGRMKFRGTAMIDGKPTEVTVSKNYGAHEFDDAEIKALLAGDEVTIHDFKTKSGTVQDVTGKLGMQQYQGRSYIGFTRTDLQPRKTPSGLDAITAPEHDGVQME